MHKLDHVSQGGPSLHNQLFKISQETNREIIKLYEISFIEDLDQLIGRRYMKCGANGIAQLSEKLLNEDNKENDIPILKYFAQLHMKNSFSFEFIGGLLEGQAGNIYIYTEGSCMWVAK